MLFLLAIADLIHPLSNNRSSIGMIGCLLPKPSCETKFSGANGDREVHIFPLKLTTSRIGNFRQREKVKSLGKISCIERIEGETQLTSIDDQIRPEKIIED